MGMDIREGMRMALRSAGGEMGVEVKGGLGAGGDFLQGWVGVWKEMGLQLGLT
jgi:hypothetical protein